MALSPTSSRSSGSSGLGAKLYDYTVTGSSKATIDTFVDNGGGGVGVALSGAYDLLDVWILCRTALAQANASVVMVLNNDTGANYDQEVVQGVDGGANIFANIATPGWELVARGDAATSLYPSVQRVSFMSYAATTFYKTAVAQMGALNTTTALVSRSESLAWRSTAAITRIGLTPVGNFLVGSRLLIFGL